jgi:hypothetical protein
MIGPSQVRRRLPIPEMRALPAPGGPRRSADPADDIIAATPLAQDMAVVTPASRIRNSNVVKLA